MDHRPRVRFRDLGVKSLCRHTSSQLNQSVSQASLNSRSTIAFTQSLDNTLEAVSRGAGAQSRRRRGDRGTEARTQTAETKVET